MERERQRDKDRQTEKDREKTRVSDSQRTAIDDKHGKFKKKAEKETNEAKKNSLDGRKGRYTVFRK